MGGGASLALEERGKPSAKGSGSAGEKSPGLPHPQNLDDVIIIYPADRNQHRVFAATKKELEETRVQDSLQEAYRKALQKSEVPVENVVSDELLLKGQRHYGPLGNFGDQSDVTRNIKLFKSFADNIDEGRKRKKHRNLELFTRQHIQTYLHILGVPLTSAPYERFDSYITSKREEDSKKAELHLLETVFLRSHGMELRQAAERIFESDLSPDVQILTLKEYAESLRTQRAAQWQDADTRPASTGSTTKKAGTFSSFFTSRPANANSLAAAESSRQANASSKRDLQRRKGKAASTAPRAKVTMRSAGAAEAKAPQNVVATWTQTASLRKVLHVQEDPLAASTKRPASATAKTRTGKERQRKDRERRDIERGEKVETEDAATSAKEEGVRTTRNANTMVTAKVVTARRPANASTAGVAKAEATRRPENAKSMIHAQAVVTMRPGRARATDTALTAQGAGAVSAKRPASAPVTRQHQASVTAARPVSASVVTDSVDPAMTEKSLGEASYGYASQTDILLDLEAGQTVNDDMTTNPQLVRPASAKAARIRPWSASSTLRGARGLPNYADPRILLLKTFTFEAE
eukprot:TRINITY_DN77151_c0_g1_i1.p1 TRINITY_DN77151_c0_g1~~TRINITY_DN77151_c0_g1_i1.p1  ORF type:complete len:580 (-),score=72.04 TRINITY_DN77151_c0_g1_i1:179-1918(-)